MTDFSRQVSDIPTGNDFTAIAAGHTHGLALKSDDSIVGWGQNHSGQLDIPAGNDYTAIAYCRQLFLEGHSVKAIS